MIFSLLRRRRRRRRLAEPFPEPWLGYLQRNFAHWAYLDADEQARLKDLIRVFIAEKYWEGCGGLEMTDEIKVTIAAQACLLILNIEHDYYRIPQTILVYPSGYFAPMRQRGGGGVVIESTGAMLGQAHHQGPVILSWQHAREGGRDAHDGRNLVYHEFAHKLDLKAGRFDGTPRLPTSEMRREWAEVMTREFQELRRGGGPGPRPLLRRYAATKPAEFFAVGTEVFFEQPVQMRSRHPDLYRLLSAFYRQDPAARMQRARGR